MNEGIKPVPRPVAATIALTLVLLALTVGLLDMLTSIWITPATVYAVLILGSLWVRDRRYLWGLVLLCLALLFGTYVIHPAVDFHSLSNRFIGSLGIIGIGLVCSALTGTWRRLEAGHQSLLQQNDSLETANRELAAREEEIARQNTELQSQAAELARQSVALQVSNNELISRERMLEHLLDLSRALTIDLNRSAVMDLICEFLSHLIPGPGAASAIQEHRDQSMVLACHHGFGPDGPDIEHIPLERSFAAQILNRGQPAFVEDLSSRPDLMTPRPKGGDPFASVLAAPLRVRGRVIGALEVYSTEKRKWSDEQVAMIESLAAQASISLEANQLFQEIEHERGRFLAVFHTLPIGVAVCDQDPGAIRFNPAAAALLNVPADVNLMRPDTARRWKMFRGVQEIGLNQLPLLRALRHGVEIAGEELEVLFATGRRVNLLVSAAPIRQRDGKIVGAVSGLADISDSKRLEQELDRRRREAEEASVRKTRFLAAVSHDIRTPANAINLLAELMRRTAANPTLAGQVPEMAAELQSSATALVNLVTDVLDLARFDTGKLELNETEFDLSAALAEESHQILPLAQTKGLEMKYVSPAHPVRVMSDRVKIGRIVANLLGNAIKFTDKGSITLELSLTADRRPRITVSDTGVGIEAKHLSRIFDEFFQLRNPERDPTKGTGLGLTICKRLLDAMEGQLSVQSKPGSGTTFVITLSAACVLSQAAESDLHIQNATVDSHPQSLPLRGMRVLLVDDHAPTRSATVQLLQREGAQVEQAATGAQALQLSGDFDPNVLLLDMMLPDMVGTDVLRALRTRPSSALQSVIVMTGDVTDERLREIKSLGVTAYLPKPIKVAELVSILISRHTIDRKSAGNNGNPNPSAPTVNHADD